MTKHHYLNIYLGENIEISLVMDEINIPNLANSGIDTADLLRYID